jgi:probable HAF family extracellular repeat protein
MTDLGTLGGSSNHLQSYAHKINNNGQIVGQSFGLDVHAHAFLYENGTMTDIGPSDDTQARAINSAGQIVGGQVYYGTPAFLYSNGSTVNLGALGGDSSSAYSINDASQIVGFSHLGSSNTQHAVLWQNSVITDLGTLGGSFIDSAAHDINLSGQIVGASSTSLHQSHAFLYENGTMRDLNHLLDATGAGWTLESANAINDSGWIVGSGVSPTGQQRAFLLTPVPEPGSCALALLGFCGLILALRRRDGPCGPEPRSRAARN